MGVKEKLQQQVGILRNRLGEIEERERKAQSLALVGRCFKYRNSYSCPDKPEDYWWKYAIVTGVGDFGHPNAFSFETDKNGDVRIETMQWFHAGWQAIPAAELALEWTDLLSRILDAGRVAIGRTRPTAVTSRARGSTPGGAP